MHIPKGYDGYYKSKYWSVKQNVPCLDIRLEMNRNVIKNIILIQCVVFNLVVRSVKHVFNNNTYFAVFW